MRSFLLNSFWLMLALTACTYRPAPVPLTASSHPLVNSYTHGIISRNASIAVVFDNSLVDLGQLPEVLPDAAIEIVPAVAGRLLRQGNAMIVFQPDGWLQPATTYTATVYLDELGLSIDQTLRTFTFSFQTRPLSWSLSDLQLVPDEGQLMTLKGSVHTSDATDTADVVQALKVVWQDQQLTPQWTHSEALTHHYFVIYGIQRPEKTDDHLHIELHPPDAAPIERTLEVPAAGRFVITSVVVVRSQPAYVAVQFSNILDAQQPLEGLVRLGQDEPIDLVREGSALQIFPRRSIRGHATLTIDKAVRDAQGQILGTTYHTSLTFELPKPQVEILSDGVIMPKGEQTLLPFRAIMLKGVVVEVFRIHSHNVLQFLQQNSLNGHYNLRYVGRIVTQKEIRLLNDDASTTSLTEWKRYAVDLSELIEPDPNAIYEVRIGFLPQHSAYPCDEALAPYKLPLPTDGQYESIMEWWTGPGGWYADYEWTHRDLPCKPAYYGAHHFAVSQVLASNIGLIAKKGRYGQLTVIATDLPSAQPLVNATVEILDLQQSLLATARTNEHGIATFSSSGEPWFVRVRYQGDVGYLRLHEGESLNMSRFDVSGTATPKGLKGFIYGERGLWRPGDSLFLHFILDDRRNPLPDDFPVKAELHDPQGRLAWSGLLPQPTDHIYPIYLATQPDDPTGLWHLNVTVGAARFRKTLRIETIRPNRLKVALDLGQEPLGIWQEPHQAQLAVEWLHGTPAPRTRVVVELTARDKAPQFEGWQQFRFTDPARLRHDNQPVTIFDGHTDAQGKATLSHIFATPDNFLAGMLELDFQIRAFEPGGNFSTIQLQKDYHPRNSYVGIRIADNSYGQKYFAAGTAVPVELAAVDPYGKPIANRQLEVGLYQVGHYWWSEDYEQIRRFAAADHKKAFQTATITTDTHGRAQWTIQTDVSGRILVRVCDPTSGHCAGDMLYLSSWQLDEQVQKEEAAMMVFGTDKKHYEIGEEVQVTVPAPDNGRIFISLENGSGVIQSFWQQAQKGDNVITFTTTPQMSPTVYISAMLIQPHIQTTNDLPMRLYGVTAIEVRDPNTHLQPLISLPQTLEPESPVNITIREAKGRAMGYTLAIVDEGLLDLTAFRTPNPHKAFYSREALGVTTWDIYDQVAGAWNGQFDRILAIGGDGELQPLRPKARANRFKPVVRVLGPFHLDAGQVVQHQVKIPNYVGSVRIMVVATNGQGAFGQAEATRPVRKPLMVLGTLPRVLGPGEKLLMPVTVFAMASHLQQVQLKVHEQTGLVRIDVPKQTFGVQPPQEHTLYIPIEVRADRVGIAYFTIEASANGQQAQHEIEIEVRNPLSAQLDVHKVIVDAGQSWQKTFAPWGMPGTRTQLLELSSLPPIDLARQLEYLVQYPYGCAEQTASAGMVQLFLPKIVAMSRTQLTQCHLNVLHAIERLTRMQLPSGGFAMWPGSTQLHSWGDLWAGHFLIEAQRHGMAVLPSVLDKWLQHVRRDARARTTDQPLIQAYRLYLLALAGQPDLGSMNFLRQQKKLPALARTRLAAAYALCSQHHVAQQLLVSHTPQSNPDDAWSATFGAPARDLALYLEAFALVGDKARAWHSWQQLAQAIEGSPWLSTHSAAWTTLAAAKYLNRWPLPPGENAQATLTIDGQLHQVELNKGTMIIQLAPPDKVHQIELRNTGHEALFVRLLQRAQPLTGQERPQQNQIQLSTWFTDESGQYIQPTRIPQGTTFYCHVGIQATSDDTSILNDMALRQVFPSGWELIQTPDNHDAQRQARITYREKRDDRIHTFFTHWRPHAQLVFTTRLQATYAGRFYLPGPFCEAMYQPEIAARLAGQWVEVIPIDDLPQ